MIDELAEETIIGVVESATPTLKRKAQQQPKTIINSSASKRQKKAASNCSQEQAMNVARPENVCEVEWFKLHKFEVKKELVVEDARLQRKLKEVMDKHNNWVQLDNEKAMLLL